MAWSRVKNLLIGMLIAVNAFLLFVYGITTWRENQYKEQLHQDLLSAAASLGIILEEGMTQPEAETLLPLQTYEDAVADQAVVRSLIGDCDAVQDATGAAVFQTERGVICLQNDGTLELTLALAEPIETVRQAKAKIRKILQVLKQSGAAPVFEEPEPNQDFRATVQLSASGVPVFNAQLTFAFYSDMLVVTGRRILHRLQQIRTQEIQELPGVLLSLFGYWEERNQLDKTIIGIELGYLAKNMNGKRVTVLPVWHVAEEFGDWYVSAVDGSIVSHE